MTFPEKTPYPLKISEEQDFSLACNDCQGCTAGEYQVYGIRAQYGGGSVLDTNTVDGVSLARKYPVHNTTYCEGAVAIETFGSSPTRIRSTWLKNKHSNGHWITDGDNVCERCNNNCFDACNGGCYGTCVRCNHCYNGPAFN